MFFFNPLYLCFALPGLLLAMWAQAKVRGAYSHWLRVRNAQGITGEQAAYRLLASLGLSNVQIEGIPGELTDHYDPRTKTLRLSAGVARTDSIASVAIVAHEIGHAVQDSTGYVPLRFRAAIVPAVQAGSWIGPLLFLAGIFLNMVNLVWLGIIFFAAGLVFALATLPVELDASNRAKRLLQSTGLVVGQQEVVAVNQVLNAAAMTYVAAAVQALSTLLYYVFIAMGMGGRRR